MIIDDEKTRRIWPRNVAAPVVVNLRWLDFCQSQLKPKRRSDAQFAVAIQSSAHHFDEVLRNREAKARAPKSPGNGAVGLLETLEDTRLLLTIEADASVLDRKA